MAIELSDVFCQPKSFKLAFKNDTPKNIEEINQEILDSVQMYAIKAVLAYTKAGRAVTFEELAKNGITEDIPVDGSEVIKVLNFDFEDEKLFVLEQYSAIPLSRLKLTVLYKRQSGLLPTSSEIPDPKIQAKDDYTANLFVHIKETVTQGEGQVD